MVFFLPDAQINMFDKETCNRERERKRELETDNRYSNVNEAMNLMMYLELRETSTD